MTKQEKIKARSHQIIEGNLRIDNGKAWITLGGLSKLFDYLHSEGVVIKVDRELPPIPMEALEDYCKREIKTPEEAFKFARAILDYQLSLIRVAGCGFFEPLIEEVLNEQCR